MASAMPLFFLDGGRGDEGEGERTVVHGIEGGHEWVCPEKVQNGALFSRHWAKDIAYDKEKLCLSVKEFGGMIKLIKIIRKGDFDVIVRLDEKYRNEVNHIIKGNWAGPILVTKGTAHDTSSSEGFVSVEDGVVTGYILYEFCETQCEVLVLESIKQNHGIGTALIEAVKEAAKENNCTRVWLITTNDNIHAIRYYQKHGFELGAVHINAIEKSRELKPSIPLIGDNDIPIKHEFEFFLTICD
jgi:GNAT superfamily N-acetyltransferase